MKNKNFILKAVKENGFCIIENFLSPKECNDTVKTLDKLLESRFLKGEYIGNNNYQVLYNYFMECPSLLNLVYNDFIFDIFSELIDKDHVLTSASARNKRISSKFDSKGATSGIGWHTDSRYVNQNTRVRPSFSYFAIFALEEFSKNNGATKYVPNSHSFDFRPEKEYDYDYEVLCADKGSLIILDTALFHKAGVSTKKSRWSIFNLYSSWFVKPYFQFNKMLSQKQLKNFNPLVKQLLHYDSIPPLNHIGRRNTLKRMN